ncbi:MAG: hypothetical protein KAG97_12660, partial [Victivallales bacterium]|nr:hypothetical protein [Victivallales bacterium]
MRKKTKRKFKVFFIACLTLAAVFLVGTLIAYSLLPSLLQDYALPLIPQYAPVSRITAEIARADIDGLRLNSLRISKNGSVGVELDGLNIFLSGAEFAKLDITGLRVRPTMSNGEFTIPGLDAIFASTPASVNAVNTMRKRVPGRTSLAIPFVAKKASLRISCSEIILTSIENGRKFVSKIPCSLSVNRDGDKLRFSACLGPIDIALRGCRVLVPQLTLNGTVEIINGDAVCAVVAEFAGASAFFGKIRAMGIRGTLPLSFSIENGAVEWKSARLAGRRDAGAFFADEIIYDDAGLLASGKLALSYHRNPDGDFAVSGKLESPLFGENALRISGLCSPPAKGRWLSGEVEAKLKLDDFASIEGALPAMSGWKTTGTANFAISAKFARGLL